MEGCCWLFVEAGVPDLKQAFPKASGADKVGHINEYGASQLLSDDLSSLCT
jgi:hypothetical protein